MHDPAIVAAPRGLDLLVVAAGLAEAERRVEATSELARLLGGEELLLFAPDPELDVVLPAPGLSQVLRGAPAWRRFLSECARQGEHRGKAPRASGEMVDARGSSLPDGTAAVLLAPGAGSAGAEPLRPLLPVLGALFRAERRIAADGVRARSAVAALERAGGLMRSLQEMRHRLEDALAVADEAREEARARAGHAESLAAELQAQAQQLQEQAVELEELNAELAARTAEAESARIVADEANRTKSQFLANMSHELRTPINAVIGYADLLSLGISGPVTGAQQAQLERIRSSSAHLLGLVNDVLDLAKVESGHMAVHHEREGLAHMAAEAVELLEVQAAKRGVALKSDCHDGDVAYIGDGDRVRQILVNLVSNAVKFTGPGGSVVLRCGTSDHPSELAAVAGDGPWTFAEVEDTGIGVDEAEQRRIFQPFVQAEGGHTRRHGGTGLGLTISRQLARLMGGDLTVSSEPGKGSRFTLWLPAAGPAAGELDSGIRVGASAPVPCPEGLAEAGARLRAALPSIAASFARRVRGELPAAAVDPMDDSEIADHVPVLLADVAALLTKAGRGAADPSLLRQGGGVQRLVAEEHGADRGRRGWPTQLHQVEFRILREEVVAAVRRSEEGAGDEGVEEVIPILEGLLDAARRVSLLSHAAAAVASGAEEPERTSG